MATMAAGYPIGVDVDPPARQDRWSVLLRVFFYLPIGFVVQYITNALAAIWLLSWFPIVFTGRFPASMHNFAAGSLKWSTRATGYLALLTDHYTPFSIGDEPQYPVHVRAEGETEDRNRITTFPLIRLIMAIPHLVVLVFLGIAAVVVVIIAWFAALFTGQVPDGMQTFLVGILRWSTRVQGYVFNLTDRYPPFSLS